MDSIPDSDFLTDQEKENARKETTVEFIKAYNARSFNYPKAAARKSAKDIQAFAEDKLVAKSFTEMRCDLPGAPRSTFLMVFSPDGTKVASTHGNHNIYISDVRTGKNVKTLMGHPRTPWCIAFHPTSNQIVASGCLGGQVRIWDLSGGSEVWSSENSTVIASLTFHPEDRLLVIATYNQLHFWDWSKPKPFATVSTATTKEKVRYVAFDPLGHKLITGISNNATPQSRWERAQRCPASSIHITPRHNDAQHSSTTPIIASPTNNQYTTRPTAPSVFSNVPPYGAGRPSQRARLTNRILAHYRAFPPRNHSDALLFRNMFGETALAMSLSRLLAQQQGQGSGGAGGSGGGGGGGGSSWDMSSVRAEAGSEVDSLPDDDRPAIYSVRDTTASASTMSFAPSRSPLPVAPPMIGGEQQQYAGDLFAEGRPWEPVPGRPWEPVPSRPWDSVPSGSRRDSTPRHVSRRDWQNLRPRNNTSGNGGDEQRASNVQQQSVDSSRPPLPSLAGRREPLSSVPDRERRISACYRNLVREYEQLVHRYLQIYRPPVMIDRGTDPMDPAYPTLRQSANAPYHQSPTSSARTTVNNPANIQPLSSNSTHNPTDMRSVCEFTTTDPSVLSPLRNYEMEAARRSSGGNAGEYNKIGSRRRQLNLSSSSRVRGSSSTPSTPSTPSTSTAAVDEASVTNDKMTLVLKRVEQALKGFEQTGTEAPPTKETQSEAVEVTNQTVEAVVSPTTTEIDAVQEVASAETNQPVVASTSNQQDQVKDLISNLTIITSMAVQLKSFSERLTLNKDNDDTNKAVTENEQEIAGPSTSAAAEKEDVPAAAVTDAAVASDCANASSSNSETPNVAANVKLAKKMLERIVEIMHTFSSSQSTSSNQPSTSKQTTEASTSQPSTSAETNPNNRKRTYSSYKNKSSRKPILLDSTTTDDSSDDEQQPRKMRKRPSIHKKSRPKTPEPTEAAVEPEPIEPSAVNSAPSIVISSSDEVEAEHQQQQQLLQEASGESNNVSINDNASDATSASMYNNVASDDIASTSDFTERRPWNYNRELEQLVTDLLHDNHDETTSLLCSTCGDSLGTCTPNVCRNNHSLESTPTTERRRRFFCHRLSAFHPTRVQTRFRNSRLSYATFFRSNRGALPSDSSYFHALNRQSQQEPALDEVINFSQRSFETEPVDGSSQQRSAGFEPGYPTYHPFDPPPELDTINPEHIGIGNMYSNIVQELESSLSDIRNIRSQRRLGETSDMLSNFSERLESIMTQSHAILRNLSTSIDSAPVEANAAGDSAGRNSARGNSTTWTPTSNRDSVVPVDSASPLLGVNRSSAANPQSVNADHSYPRPTSNMSPLMASLHLTVSHIWRQARLLRSQMDSIERIDRAMLELAQLRVMRQMFADLSLYFCVSDHNIRRTNHHQDTGRHNRVSSALDRNISRTNVHGQTGTNSTGTGTTTTTDQTTVNSMRRMMAGTRISDNTNTSTPTPARRPQAQPTPATATPSSNQHRSSGVTLRLNPATKLYPCVLVMHPRDQQHHQQQQGSQHHGRRHHGGAAMSSGSGGRRMSGRTHPRQLTRRSLYRQMGGMGMGGMSMVDVAAPGRARNYMNLLNPDTFPALSHRLEHYLIEHGRLIGRHPTSNNSNNTSIDNNNPQPSTSTSNSSSFSGANNSSSNSTGNNNVTSERVLTVRLNNCRMRMHRLLGGRSQYGTNANTGPQSLVSRDGASRYNARHTLCIMLDTLSRFMEVYGTGLVGISGSFRTYLREVIDLSRLLSEVLLLQIVDAIPPPTGMMLDPERENLAQRIDDMCSRMILTRLSSQSQPLTRCLRIMRLNVRFFSHAISQNRLLEERFNSNSTNSSSQDAGNLNQTETRAEPVLGPSLPHFSVRNTLNEVRRRQRQNREVVATVAPAQPPLNQPSTTLPSPPPPPTTITEPPDLSFRHINRPEPPQTQPDVPQSAPRQTPWRPDQRSVAGGQFLDDDGEAWNRISLPSGPATTNMAELLYQRLGLDIEEDVPQPWVVVPRAEVSAANEHVGANSITIPPPLAATPSSPSPSLGEPQQPSAATTENQRFLDSLANPPTTTAVPSTSSAAPRATITTPASTTTTTANVSRESRVQQQQQQLQQLRRLYMRSSSYDGGASSTSSTRISGGGSASADRPSAPSRLAARGEGAVAEGADGVEGRSGLYPMYYRSSPIQWSLPEVQLNNVPIMRDNQDNLYVQPGRSGSGGAASGASIGRFQIHRDLLDEPVFLHHRGVSVARAPPPPPPPPPPPLFSRPRFLHPFYTWSHAHMSAGQVGGLIDASGGDEERGGQHEGRGAGEQLYETDIIAAVTPNHRIQVWEFNKMGEGHAIIPNITNALKNVVVGECKIHNDASVDIATDGSVLVTLLPSNSYLNITNRLGIYSLDWETLGQILYITTFDQNAVSVSLSPLSRHLVVGLASRRVSIMPSEQWTLARIFLLDGRRMAFGRLSLMKEIEQSRETNFVMSVNCIRWLPTSGQGLVFATNTGQLRILN